MSVEVYELNEGHPLGWLFRLRCTFSTSLLILKLFSLDAQKNF